MNNDLLEQLQKWNEDNEYQKIIDELEKIPKSDLDYSLKGQLARAYNNHDEFQKALDLLYEIENEGKNDVNWHYRAGYAFYYLEQFEQAKEQFMRCYELDSEDEDIRMFLHDCNDAYHFGSYLNFGKERSMVLSFKNRCDNFWNWFCENEDELLNMVKNEQNYENDQIIEFVMKGTALICDDMSFNLGGDFEFNFTAEGKTSLFYLMPYLISRMPEGLQQKWHFSPFAPSAAGQDFDFSMYEKNVKISDIQVYMEFDEEDSTFSIFYFSEVLNELEYEENINAFCIMMELACGEATSYMYVKNVDKADSRMDGMFPLTELENRIKQALIDKNINMAEKPDENYCIYKMKAIKSGEFRMDVEIGTSCYQDLISEFYNNTTEEYDSLLNCGAFPLYIAVSYWESRNNLPEIGNEIIKIRHEIEDKIQNEILGERGTGTESGIVLGGAMGTGTFYIDLLLYDMEGFEAKIASLLEEEYNLSYYLFNFRRGHKL